MKKNLLFITFFLPLYSLAQNLQVQGFVHNSAGDPIPFASVYIDEKRTGTQADENGLFQLKGLSSGKYRLKISSIGFAEKIIPLELKPDEIYDLNILLEQENTAFDEVVVSGTLNPVTRLESPVPVEIYTPKFFQRNPTPNVFEALQNVNGVRPQINCNVCNTGDIHINGLEGPYTMILIDGMPIVSGLSTVYGLSGIPNSLIERMEIVKGPASSLYGSEAVGGLINIITKTAAKSSKLSLDLLASGWGETNLDLGFRNSFGKKTQSLVGINFFNYTNPIDNNGDNFTDLTLQKRISVFNKWSVLQKNNKLFQVAARYFYEDRWGGEMNWTPAYRGGTDRYGESIYTSRWEILGQYELPTKENIKLSFSLNRHKQNSFYGQTPFHAIQQIGFAQLVWTKQIHKHDLTGGLAIRNTLYDDNTPATANELNADITKPSKVTMPGVFGQDQIKIDPKSTLLLGYRFDYHPEHQGIHTPRIAFKYSPNSTNTLRLNMGTGFRVVNVFTEDHAALTGARKVEILGNLAPERSYNVNFNYMSKIITQNSGFIGLDFTAFYTYFTNRITPDYTTDVQKIYYRNLNGFALSKGISANVDFNLKNGISISSGFTLMDNVLIEKGEAIRPMLTENFQGNWSASFPILKYNFTLDYTGNLYSPMKLPTLGLLDPRPESSPWWSIQNVQITYKPKGSEFAFYTGIKNLLNFTPPANSIARSNDPFDKKVEYNSQGEILATPENPFALSFDPSYVFAPNQGRRLFFGVRWSMK